MVDSSMAFQAGNEIKTAISIVQNDDSIAIKIGKDLFTNYVSAGHKKPVFYPVYGPGQIGMTRNWPLNPNVEGEAHDHPHQQSLWFAHEINNIDFWTGAGGSIQVVEAKVLPKQNGFSADSIWVRNEDGATVCSDSTRYLFGYDDSCRWIDATVKMHATNGDIVFNDTKEGSFAVRTHPDLRLTASPDDGVKEVFGSAQNSEGVVGKAIWGKKAKWVLYHGPINGTPMAIAMFDHPDNLRHPTTWHARDYGLVAANPFGLHDFTGSPVGSGEHLVKSGDSLTLRYRILFLKGNPSAEDVETRYAEFSENQDF